RSIMINSGFLDGMEVPDAISRMIDEVETRGIGKGQINYKLRDANFSRQRYWGEPFPLVFDQDGLAEALPLNELPLALPDTEDFKPGRKPPLARLEGWVNEKAGYVRETDVMPAVAGSSWYFLRYMDANNENEFASKEAIDYWRDVDLYVGGSEHAVAHLMYARFWHKFLFDKGLVPTNEPFKKLINQGMIQGVIEFIYLQKEKEEGVSIFYCANLAKQMIDVDLVKIPVHIDFVNDYGSDTSYMNQASIDQFLRWRPEYRGAKFICANGVYQDGNFTATKDGAQATHLVTHSEVGKMSKSKFNVINPDDITNKFGTDCFRMYEMFLGPIEQSKPWDTNGIDGVHKFLRKYWSLFYNEQGAFLPKAGEADKADLKTLHTCIKKVNQDIERFSFNTCVSAFMVCVNELKKNKCNN
ncbi:MAG: class I tRNA ligase family protein, partial [Bacteroidota bacterium]